MDPKEGLNSEEETRSTVDKMFDFQDETEEQEEQDLSEFEGIGNISAAPEEQASEEEGEEGEEDDEIDFSDPTEKGEEEEEAEDDDIDLEAFNKKMDTDFKTKEELKSFMKGEAAKDDLTDEDTKEYEKAKNTIDLYDPIVNLDDESLMREEFKAIEINKARNEGRTLSPNDEDMLYEVEEKIQELKDSNVLDLKADKLRETLRDKFLNPAKQKVEGYDKKQEELKEAQRKSDDEKIQNKLADIYKNKNFYGITPEKERIAKAYKKVSSGKFIQELESNKEYQAELAAVAEYLSEIGKKAGGPTHSDGIKSVLDDYKSKKSKNGDGTFANAQKRGTSGGNDGARGLLADLLYEAPVED
jgi:hypothetical protein